jgi:hypothetical protein
MYKQIYGEENVNDFDPKEMSYDVFYKVHQMKDMFDLENQEMQISPRRNIRSSSLDERQSLRDELKNFDSGQKRRKSPYVYNDDNDELTMKNLENREKYKMLSRRLGTHNLLDSKKIELTVRNWK